MVLIEMFIMFEIIKLLLIWHLNIKIQEVYRIRLCLYASLCTNYTIHFIQTTGEYCDFLPNLHSFGILVIVFLLINCT